jgi:hypothetical protein
LESTGWGPFLGENLLDGFGLFVSEKFHKKVWFRCNPLHPLPGTSPGRLVNHLAVLIDAQPFATIAALSLRIISL